MTIADMSFWNKSLLILRIFLKDNKTNVSSVDFLKAIEKDELKDVSVIGRGGVEVSIDEIKKSHQFKEMQEYAKIKVNADNGRVVDHSTTD